MGLSVQRLLVQWSPLYSGPLLRPELRVSVQNSAQYSVPPLCIVAATLTPSGPLYRESTVLAKVHAQEEQSPTSKRAEKAHRRAALRDCRLPTRPASDGRRCAEFVTARRRVPRRRRCRARQPRASTCAARPASATALNADRVTATAIAAAAPRVRRRARSLARATRLQLDAATRTSYKRAAAAVHELHSKARRPRSSSAVFSNRLRRDEAARAPPRLRAHCESRRRRPPRGQDDSESKCVRRTLLESLADHEPIMLTSRQAAHAAAICVHGCPRTVQKLVGQTRRSGWEHDEPL